MLRPESFWFVLATSFVPFAVLSYPVAGVLLALLRPKVEPVLRRWVTAGIGLAVAGTVFHGILVAPAFLGDHPTGSADLVVLNLNTHLGEADIPAALAEVRKVGARVAVFEEVTPAELQRLLDAGITDVLPYRAGNPGDGSSGTMAFSTYPLTEVVPLPLHHDSYRIKVGAPVPFWLVAVHAAQPLVAPGDWRADWSVLNQVVPELPGPVLLVGDFNTTLDHPPLRDLLGRGFSDAARNANSGWQPTWPSGGPGLMAIDHVISSGPYRAISTSTFTVGGTDHHGLVARLAAR